MSHTRRLSSAPACFIVPPHLLKHLSRQSDPKLRGAAEAALFSLSVSEQLRGERSALGGIAPQALTPRGVEHRTIFDCRHQSNLPGKEVRREREKASADLSANEAYEGLGRTYDFFEKVYRRNSLDGGGMNLDASVHYRSRFDNAFWNGRQMVFGDGDGVIFRRFTHCVDVIAHELTHGITQYEADLDYEGQPGALNEHFSDVFGSLVKQFVLNQTAEQADWLIGEGLWARGVKGVALRSMKSPGTAYDDPRIGKDPQPAHMSGYLDTDEDNGGVHINSGIPNHAFYLVALGLGGHAWLKAGKIWYVALKDVLSSASSFKDAARVTAGVAGEQFGASAATIVRDAWKQVGVSLGARRGKLQKISGGPQAREEQRAARNTARVGRGNEKPAA